MKINSIYDVIGSVDDKFVFEAAAVGRKKRPVLLIVAAAAAALVMLVGFTEKFGNGRNKVIIGDNKAMLMLDLRAKDINIPEKYLDEDGMPYYIDNAVQMSISELAAEFGVEPLGINNDKFSEEIRFTPNPVWNGKGELLWTYNGEPQLVVSDSSVDLRYNLYSKTLNRNIGFGVTYITDDKYSSGEQIGGDMKYNIIKLKNGAQCLVTENFAQFSYDGAEYTFGFKTLEDDKQGSFDNTMQILKDLGLK